jgi:hypothetical protein
VPPPPPYSFTVQSSETYWTDDGDAVFISSGSALSNLTNFGTIWAQSNVYAATAISTGNGWGLITNHGGYRRVFVERGHRGEWRNSHQ